MEVNRVSLPDKSGYASNTAAGSDKVVKSAGENSKVTDQKATFQDRRADTKEDVSRDELDTLTEELNKLMQNFNADLHFSIHEKTQQLMVQLIDEKNNKVLKEYPSHEFLDMIARISDYVGVLLDKKA
jgi:flagellar protein FlaG